MHIRLQMIVIFMLATTSTGHAQRIVRDGQLDAMIATISSDGRLLAQRLDDSTIVRWSGDRKSVIDTIRVARMYSMKSIAFVGSRLYVLTESELTYINEDGGRHTVAIKERMPGWGTTHVWPMMVNGAPTFTGIHGESGCPYLIYYFRYSLAGGATSIEHTGEINLIDTHSHTIKVRHELGRIFDFNRASDGTTIMFKAQKTGLLHVSGDDDVSYNRNSLYELNSLTGAIRYSDEPLISIGDYTLPIPVATSGLALTASGLYQMYSRQLLPLTSPPEKFISGLATHRMVIGADPSGTDVVLCAYDLSTGEKMWFDTLHDTQLDKLDGWANQQAGTLYIDDRVNSITYRYRYSRFDRGDTVVVRYNAGPHKLYSDLKYVILAFTSFDIATFEINVGDSVYSSKKPINSYKLMDTGELRISARVMSKDENRYYRSFATQVECFKPPEVYQAFYFQPNVITGVSCVDDTLAVVGLNGWSIGSTPETSCIGCFTPWFSGTGTSIATLYKSGSVVFDNRVREDHAHVRHNFRRSDFSLDTSYPIDVATTSATGYYESQTGYYQWYPMAESGFTWIDRRSGRVRGLLRNSLFWGSAPYLSIIFELGEKDSGITGKTLFNAGSRQWTSNNGYFYPALFDIDVNYPDEYLVTMSTSIESFSSNFDRVLFSIKLDTLNSERGAFRRDDSTIVTTKALYKLRDGVWYRSLVWDFERGGNLIRLNNSHSFVVRYRPDSVGYIFNHDNGTVIHRYGAGFAEPTCAAYDEIGGKIWIGDEQGVVASYKVEIPYDPVSVDSDESPRYVCSPSAQISTYAGIIWISATQPLLSVVVFDILGHELGRYAPPTGAVTFQISSLPTWSGRVAVVQVRSDTGVTSKILILD